MCTPCRPAAAAGHACHRARRTFRQATRSRRSCGIRRAYSDPRRRAAARRPGTGQRVILQQFLAPLPQLLLGDEAGVAASGVPAGLLHARGRGVAALLESTCFPRAKILKK